VRKRSKREFFGFPLWEVARGPDPERGERVGHARGIIAIGDVADGVIAIGGISRGVISIGGISFGICSLGGVSVGLAAALGGVAIAPLALGGIAVGVLALGGAGFDIHGRLHHQPQSVLSSFLASFPSLTSRIPATSLGGRISGRGRRT
jgi:hypothetical protein